MQTGYVDIEGSRLYYEIRGKGPPLLLLQGGDGDARGMAALTAELAKTRTVVSYDRRGLSRSAVITTRPVTIDLHARDAGVLIAALDLGAPDIFGASMGAVVGLAMLAGDSDKVARLVAHEAPLTQLLSPSERALAVSAQEDVERLFASSGVPAATARFISIAGMNFSETEPGATLPAAAPERMQNLQFFLANDAPAVRLFTLDLDKIRPQAGKIICGAGALSGDAFPHQCAVALAAALGRPVVEFPGGHSGFLTHPRGFALKLTEVLEGA